jgi:hypothetical protein
VITVIREVCGVIPQASRAMTFEPVLRMKNLLPESAKERTLWRLPVSANILWGLLSKSGVNDWEINAASVAGFI